MGLLTNIDPQSSKLYKLIRSHHIKLSVLLYIGGLVWFFVIAVHLSVPPYFSHNAFLTGLANREFHEEKLANNLHRELVEHVQNSNNNSIPDSWLVSKFQEIGIEAYMHNFSVKHPLQHTVLKGKNVYGILRTPRGHSNEAIVLSAPFRPLNGESKPTTPSIALMLAFAKFANRQNYWAKDIIFLITEHELLGAHAWLEAYHEVCFGHPDYIEYGELTRRSGFLLGAINLELHDTQIGHIDLKVEGFNGRVPNLNLIEASVKMTGRHGLVSTYKNRIYQDTKDPIADWLQLVQTLMLMMCAQAAGAATGNHGVFLNFGIHSLTLEGYGPVNWTGVGLLEVGRVVEALLRCLNNLVQGFHQSFFFYLLTATKRFISIGTYMPAAVLISGALFAKAFGKWLHLQEEIEANQNRYDTFLFLISIAMLHLFGVLMLYMPRLISNAFIFTDANVEDTVVSALIIFSIMLLFLPSFMPENSQMSKQIHIFALVELAIVLICLAMTNISLSLFVAILYMPAALLIGLQPSRFCNFIFKIILFIAHPIVALVFISIAFAYAQFDSLEHMLSTSLYGTIREAIVAAIISNIIYGHWFYSLFTAVLIPNWLCFWIVANCSQRRLQHVNVKKLN